ncbi:skin secretory protein xP2-like [Schistocerca piceifrons]|uniref:skin secretory protein xP2-like n=1 Tax=Schistocerca piceifrons TaxID=274613 RepID=UPI001F5E8AF1|nr:skin secretory protein xP2-like [Schistocerca piceifrons]
MRDWGAPPTALLGAATTHHHPPWRTPGHHPPAAPPDSHAPFSFYLLSQWFPGADWTVGRQDFKVMNALGRKEAASGAEAAAGTAPTPCQATHRCPGPARGHSGALGSARAPPRQVRQRVGGGARPGPALGRRGRSVECSRPTTKADLSAPRRHVATLYFHSYAWLPPPGPSSLVPAAASAASGHGCCPQCCSCPCPCPVLVPAAAAARPQPVLPPLALPPSAAAAAAVLLPQHLAATTAAPKRLQDATGLVAASLAPNATAAAAPATPAPATAADVQMVSVADRWRSVAARLCSRYSAG